MGATGGGNTQSKGSIDISSTTTGTNSSNSSSNSISKYSNLDKNITDYIDKLDLTRMTQDNLYQADYVEEFAEKLDENNADFDDYEDYLIDTWHEQNKELSDSMMHLIGAGKADVDFEAVDDEVGKYISDSTLISWYRDENSDVKPQIIDAQSEHPELRVAMMNNLFHIYNRWAGSDGYDYKKSDDFNKWLYTPITVYRGTHGQRVLDSDVFEAFTPSKKVADKFADSDGSVETLKIRPIDTMGSGQTSGEVEVDIPVWVLKKLRGE